MKQNSKINTFVCAGICDNKLILKEINADTVDDALKLFNNESNVYDIKAVGPFLKIKKKNIESNKVLKFVNNKPYKAIYDEYLVNAFDLSDPKDQAYIIFIKRLDNKKIPFPKGTITVPVNDLRCINDEQRL